MEKNIALCILFIVTLSQANIITSINNGFWNEPTTWQGGNVPVSTDTVVIGNNTTVTIQFFGNDCQRLVVDGILQFDTTTFLVAYTVIVKEDIIINGIVRPQDPNYFPESGGRGGGNFLYTSGNLIVNGTLQSKMPPFANISIKMEGNTVDGNIISNSTLNLYELEINKPGKSVVLNTNIETDRVTFMAGLLKTGSYGIKSGIVDGNLNNTNHVIGNLSKIFLSGNNTQTFEVGTANGYTPVTVQMYNVVNSTTLTVSVDSITHPNVVDPSSTMKRYCKITNSGSTFDSCSATFTYLSIDFNTNFVEATDEPAMVVGKYDNGIWTFPVIKNRLVGTNNDGGTITVSGLTSFSEFAIGKTASVLPVELTSFESMVRGKTVHLYWNTAFEINNVGFNVEKAVISNQLSVVSEWKTIGFVEGSGMSNQQHQYNYNDKVSTAGTYHYRLKQIDKDGKSSYSKIIEVHVPVEFSLPGNYPNPFNPTTTIYYSVKEKSKTLITIYDITGQEVRKLYNDYQNVGNYTIVWDGKNQNGESMSSGIYICKIAIGNIQQSLKMVLAK